MPVAIDHTGCNGNEDINFRFTGFVLILIALKAVLNPFVPQTNNKGGTLIFCSIYLVSLTAIYQYIPYNVYSVLWTTDFSTC